jgi:hypothetical protein
MVAMAASLGMPDAMKAALSGAKRVKSLVLSCSVVSIPALIRAALRKLYFGSVLMISPMEAPEAVG